MERDLRPGVCPELFAQAIGRLDPGRIEKDSNSVLQELVQGRFKKVPEYRLVAARGAGATATLT